MKTEKELEKIKKQMKSYFDAASKWTWINNHAEAHYKINPDGSVDILKNTVISLRGFVKKLPFKINSIKGGLEIQGNNLTTLEGLPEKVHGWLSLYTDNLNSLEYCPNYIKGKLIISCNGFLFLEGIDYVGGSLDIRFYILDIEKIPKVRGITKCLDWDRVFENQLNAVKIRRKNIKSILN